MASRRLVPTSVREALGVIGRFVPRITLREQSGPGTTPPMPTWCTSGSNSAALPASPIEHEGGFARRDADHIGAERPVPATASPQRKDAVEYPGARRWIPRRFRWCRNSSKLVCRLLERQNSSGLAGQRLTDSPLQCAKELLRP